MKIMNSSSSKIDIKSYKDCDESTEILFHFHILHGRNFGIVKVNIKFTNVLQANKFV
jgi:hypothetical protein